MTFYIVRVVLTVHVCTSTCNFGLLHRDTPNTPPPSLHTSQGASSADVRGDVTVVRDRLMHIKVKLIDKKCPDLATKYNQVCHVKHCAIPGVNTTDKTVGLVCSTCTSIKNELFILCVVTSGAAVHRHRLQPAGDDGEPADVGGAARLPGAGRQGARPRAVLAGEEAAPSLRQHASPTGR